MLWHWLLELRERPVSECGRLRHGAGGHPAGRPPPERANVDYAPHALEHGGVVSGQGRVQKGARGADRDSSRMIVSGGRLNLSRAASDSKAY